MLLGLFVVVLVSLFNLFCLHLCFACGCRFWICLLIELVLLLWVIIMMFALGVCSMLCFCYLTCGAVGGCVFGYGIMLIVGLGCVYVALTWFDLCWCVGLVL